MAETVSACAYDLLQGCQRNGSRCSVPETAIIAKVCQHVACICKNVCINHAMSLQRTVLNSAEACGDTTVITGLHV